MSSSNSHSSAIRASDLSLWTWGLNATGQLGDGTVLNRYSPVKIGNSSWSMVSEGINYSVGIDTNGNLYTWGGNGSGQLGDGTTANKSSPVNVGLSFAYETSFLPIASSGFGNMFYVLGGNPASYNLYAWGVNTLGQLGSALGGVQYSPTNAIDLGVVPFVGVLDSWKAISSGGSHTVAIRSSDSSLWAWGYNTSGQLGDGTVTQRNSPVKIGSSSWSKVSVGMSTTAAIDITGALYTWGQNDSGQLGDGTTIKKSSPVKIGSSSWSMVGGGGNHTVAIDTTGALYTWGFNNTGQLGDGTTINKSSPVQIGSSSWSFVYGGKGFFGDGNFSGGITSDKLLYEWGTFRSSPVQLGTNSWKTAIGGRLFTTAIDTTGALYAWGVNFWFIR